MSTQTQTQTQTQTAADAANTPAVPQEPEVTVTVTDPTPGLGTAPISVPKHSCRHCERDCGWAYGPCGVAIPGCRFLARDPMYFD
jgi:hypothetical protein